MAVRSTWQILTGGWVGKLAIDMMTPVVCDLILHFVIASCVALSKTIEGHNWNRIANAKNQKKKLCDIRWDAGISIFVVAVGAIVSMLNQSELLSQVGALMLLKRSKCESFGNETKKNNATINNRRLNK